MTPQLDAKDLEDLLGYLQAVRGFDFRVYKESSLRRRVSKRLQAVGVTHGAEYLAYLEAHPEEFALLFNTVLINVTSFFRDTAAWDCLASEIVPRIVSGAADGPIRVSSVGCASGEEAYTLAILFVEALGVDEFRRRVKIYATDMDEDALHAARQAGYDGRQIRDVPPHLIEKYFESRGGQHVVCGDLRRGVIFGRQDVVRDAPISRLDLLVCRNTLMYFNGDVQARIAARFHFALKEQGFLFLGKAEMLAVHAAVFAPVNVEWRIFAKAPRLPTRERVLLLAHYGARDAGTQKAQQLRLREQLFDKGDAAELVVDSRGLLSLANEKARALFGLGPSDLGRLFRDMPLSWQPVDLRSPLDRVFAGRAEVRLEDLEWPQPSGDAARMTVRFVPLPQDGGGILGVGICLRDVTAAFATRRELQQAQHELETANEELQSTNEELETTNEELQSTNEELETTNEELQATNEELETLNEELQATNEEQRTLNEQLQERSAELDRLGSDLGAILSGIRPAIVVTDAGLHVEIWNRGAEELWGLRAEEVRGKSFLDLDIGLPSAQLEGAMRACLDNDAKAAFQEVRLAATNRRGRPIQCHVALTPLVGPANGIRGVILLMEERQSNERSGP